MKQRGRCVSSSALKTLRILTILLPLSFIGSASAVSTATITGRVTDLSNAVIPKVKIDGTNIDTNVNYSTETSSEGIYALNNLPPGRYRLFVSKEGFRTIVKSDIVLHVQDILSLSFTMEVGSITQSLTIGGDTPLIQTESASVGTLVNRQFVENLPLNGRSFHALFELTPGAVLTKSSAIEQGQFSVNGQRADANYFTIDGVSASIGVSAGASPGQSAVGALPGLNAFGGTNNLVSVDALQEFRIQTSTYAPEFGRTPGAQVSIVTRNGTNQFSGTLFNYFRNDALDATDWFTNSRSQKKAALRQNDFGGVLGGPIVRDHTFFFFSYEGLRLRQPQTGIISVPSLNARRTAPAQIQPFLNAYPLPNGKDLGLERTEFSASYSNPSTLDATSIRVDHTVNSKLTLFGRYNYAPSDNTQRIGALVTLSQTSIKTQTFTSGTTLALSPKLSNDFRANYSRNRAAGTFTIDDFGGAAPPPDSALLLPFMSRQNTFYSFSITGVSSFSIGKNVDNLQRQINLIDNLSWVAGSHQWKFGIDYRQLSPIINSAAYILAINFNGVTTANDVRPGTALSGITASNASIQAYAEPRTLLLSNYSAFAQDTWKAGRRLTLTYGLRWEVNPPPREESGNQYALIGLDNPATLTLSSRGAPLWRTTYNNYAPRIGMAYQLARESGRETVLRGGFGVFYDLGNNTSALGFQSNAFPYVATKPLSNEPYPLDPAKAQPPPVSSNLPTNSAVFTYDPNLKLPYTYQWNFAVEQSLGSNQTLTASYVGAVGRRLLRRDLLSRPNPNFFTVQVTRNTATSDYHALQLQFQRRLSRGLQTLVSYTWSHSIDSTSNNSAANAPIGKINLDQERGPSDFDVRQTLIGAFTYNIPAAPVGRIGGAILRDWSIDTIFRTRSGTPVDVLVGTDILGVGSPFVSRPDLVLGVPLWIDDRSVAGGRRINKAAFNPNFTGRQGTLGRNSLRGFSVSQVDFALRRQFKLTERFNLQLRAELFNIFNHPNFGDPQGTLKTSGVDNPLFGQSTRMLGASLGSGGASGGFNPLYQIGGPRSAQLALKLTF